MKIDLKAIIDELVDKGEGCEICKYATLTFDELPCYGCIHGGKCAEENANNFKLNRKSKALIRILQEGIDKECNRY